MQEEWVLLYEIGESTPTILGVVEAAYRPLLRWLTVSRLGRSVARHSSEESQGGRPRVMSVSSTQQEI